MSLREKSLGYLLSRVVDGLVSRLLSRLSGTRWIGLSAACFRASVHQMAVKPKTPGPSPHTILVLSKAIFNEDVLATFGHDRRCNLYSVHRQIIKSLAEPFLPAHVDENNYVELSPEDHERKRAYRTYLVELLRRIQKRFPIQAVLTANFAYYAEREFAAACEALGIAFIALHKENIRSPGFAEFMVWLYRTHRGPFTGRRILVYNELERQNELSAGVAPPDRITVTGMSRLDRCHAHRVGRAAAGKGLLPPPRVLFFSFGPQTLLPGRVRKLSRPPYTRYRDTLPEPWQNLGWHRLHEETHRAMLTLALSSPEISVVIKMKGAESDREAMALQDLLHVDHLPANLTVARGGDPLALITQSSVVCGINTTALLESIAAGVPVVAPRFAECVDDIMKHYVVDFEDAVDYADSPEQLVSKLKTQALAGRPHEIRLAPAAVRMLDKWLGNSDGHATDRVREAVLAEIETGSA